MATLTIQLDEETLRKLQERAARNGRSAEAVVSEVVVDSLQEESTPNPPLEDLGTSIRKRFAFIGGIDLPIAQRQFSTRAGHVFDA